MPPRRQPGSPGANPLDLIIQLVAAYFADRPGGARQAAVVVFCLLAVCILPTFGWYLCQSGQRKQEIVRLIANSQNQHKGIKVTEVVWDIWTLYFHRPFVPTNVHPGEGTMFGGEPERTAFPHALRSLYNKAYTVGYCDDLGDPAWVCYRVFDVDGHVRPPKRPEGFLVDGRTSARVESGDYVGSGYDRGHMAPNYAIGTRFGAAAQEETFFLSNVCPQRHRLNAGLWKDLETRIVDNYTGRYGQVWVIDGPIFGSEDRLQHLRGGVSVPVAFYMIIVQTHEGGVRAEAFSIGQEASSNGSLDSYLTSVAEIERKTGLRFFPGLEQQARSRLEEKAADSMW